MKKNIDEIRKTFDEKKKEKTQIELDSMRDNTMKNFGKLTHSRLATINDGVFAIILTIMVLAIDIPRSFSEYPYFLFNILIFIISFFIVANFWYELHITFATFSDSDHLVVVLNFIFLAILSLIPLMTKLIMTSINRYSVVSYGLVYLLSTVSLSFIFFAAHRKYMHENSDFLLKIMWFRIFFKVFLNLIFIAISIFVPKVGVVLYLILPIYSFLTDRLEKRPIKIK